MRCCRPRVEAWLAARREAEGWQRSSPRGFFQATRGGKTPLVVNLLRLRCAGLSNIAIAERLGVSRQRIAQRLAPRVAIRRIVVERARGQCEHCGLPIGRSGWIHHKTSRGMTCDRYNDLNNLALVCPPCHRRAGRTRRKEFPTRLPLVAGPNKASRIRLGEQILQRRQEQGITQKQLATRAHTSHAYLAGIERGRRLASGDLVARIARVLRCSAIEFVADWAARGGQRRADRHQVRRWLPPRRSGRLNVAPRSLQ